MKNVYKYSALVIAAILILFLLLMASDTFETGLSWYNITGFFVQSIPAFVIAAASVLGFFRPRLGFYIFFIISAVFTIYFHTYQNVINFMVISFPPLLISILMFASSMKIRSK